MERQQATGKSEHCSDRLGNTTRPENTWRKLSLSKIEIGDRNGEATTYVNLGTVFISLGKYGKAQEYLEKALAINIETGERNGEATTYGNRTLFI